MHVGFDSGEELDSAVTNGGSQERAPALCACTSVTTMPSSRTLGCLPGSTILQRVGLLRTDLIGRLVRRQKCQAIGTKLRHLTARRGWRCCSSLRRWGLSLQGAQLGSCTKGTSARHSLLHGWVEVMTLKCQASPPPAPVRAPAMSLSLH